MKFIISATEFKASTQLCSVIAKEFGISHPEFEKVALAVRQNNWIELPEEKNIVYVWDEQYGPGRNVLKEVHFIGDDERNAEFMLAMIPWVKKIAPISMAVFNLLSIFKNVVDEIRDDMKALQKKWKIEDINQKIIDAEMAKAAAKTTKA